MVSFARKVFRVARWKAAQTWLSFWPNVEVIGVAGSVGKTTTKEVIAAILSARFKTVKTSANLDPIFNLPITSFKTYGACKFVAELSVDKPGQMDKYLSLIKPRVGVLTRLSLEHTDSEHFGSLEKAIKEELKLLKSLPMYGWAVLNGDDEQITKSSNLTKAKKLFYGFGEQNDIRIRIVQQKVTGSKVESTLEIKYDTGNVKLTTNLLGKQNAVSVGAGVCVGILFGLGFDDIQKGLLTVQAAPGRLEPKVGKWGLILDDSYNASPAAVEAAIDVLVDLDPCNNILVLGDMLELGDYSKDAHLKVGKYAREKGVNALAVYGKYAKDVVRSFGGDEKQVFIAKGHSEIVDWVNKIGKGVILVKGSHSMHMEKVVEGLINKD